MEEFQLAFRAYREVNDDFDYFVHPEIESEFWNLARVHEFPVTQRTPWHDRLGNWVYVGDILFSKDSGLLFEVEPSFDRKLIYARRSEKIIGPMKDLNVVGNIFQPDQISLDEKVVSRIKIPSETKENVATPSSLGDPQ